MPKMTVPHQGGLVWYYMYVVLGWFEVLSTMNQYSTVLIFGSYGNAFCVYHIRNCLMSFKVVLHVERGFGVVLYSFEWFGVFQWRSGQLAPKTTRPKTTRPEENSPKTTRPTFRRQLAPYSEDNSPHSAENSPKVVLMHNLLKRCPICMPHSIVRCGIRVLPF